MKTAITAWRITLAKSGIQRSHRRITSMKPYNTDPWARGWLRTYEEQLKHYQEKLAWLDQLTPDTEDK